MKEEIKNDNIFFNINDLSINHYNNYLKNLCNIVKNKLSSLYIKSDIINTITLLLL